MRTNAHYPEYDKGIASLIYAGGALETKLCERVSSTKSFVNGRMPDGTLVEIARAAMLYAAGNFVRSMLGIVASVP